MWKQLVIKQGEPMNQMIFNYLRGKGRLALFRSLYTQYNLGPPGYMYLYAHKYSWTRRIATFKYSNKDSSRL